MTAVAFSQSTGPLPRDLGAPVSTDRILLAGVAIQLAFLLPTIGALLIETRQLNGINLWIKPLKFELSMGLNLLTLFVLLRALPVADRDRRFIRWSALAVAAASTFEIAYIALQAARGVGSHYNVGTWFEALGYQLMGIGAVTMVLGAFLIGLAIRRSAPQPGRDGFHLGAWSGLVAGSVLTLVTAGVLSAGIDGPGHWIGGVRSDATGLPITGWSTTGGDLRVPHFFATHLAQALPVLGFIVDRLRLPAPRWWIATGAAIGVVVVALTFAQALAGRPFLVAG
ncbi:MAG: hypothetical protein ACRCTI_17480 [Beijerinckiaceae bacterium]